MPKYIYNTVISLLPLTLILLLYTVFGITIDEILTGRYLPVSPLIFLFISLTPLLIAFGFNIKSGTDGHRRLHPSVFIAPIGFLLLVMLSNVWYGITAMIPSACHAGTMKELRSWPDREEGYKYDPSIVIVYRGEGNSRKVNFTSGYININYLNTNGVSSLSCNLTDMTCYYSYGRQLSPLTVESLSKHFSSTSITKIDPQQIAEDTYESIMEIKAARSNKDLDATYAPI